MLSTNRVDGAALGSEEGMGAVKVLPGNGADLGPPESEGSTLFIPPSRDINKQ